MTTKSEDKSIRIAAFESRRMAEMAKMIERAGAAAFVSPSMREVTVDEDRPAIDFANRLITGQIDVAIFLTGVGVRKFIERIERHVPRQRFLDTLADIQTVVRGLKPLAARSSTEHLAGDSFHARRRVTCRQPNGGCPGIRGAECESECGARSAGRYGRVGLDLPLGSSRGRRAAKRKRPQNCGRPGRRGHVYFRAAGGAPTEGRGATW